MNIHDELKKIISEISNQNIDISNIGDETILTNDCGFDSIQIISLIINVESKFDIELSDEDLDIEKLTVYKTLYEIIISKLTLVL